MARPVYLVDLSCYKPPEELKVLASDAIKNFAQHWPMFSKDGADFMWRVFLQSGLSPHGTYLPAHIHPNHVSVPKTDAQAQQSECHMVMFGAVDQLLKKSGMNPEDIDIVVTMCDVYCPLPSMASILVNKYKMRSSVQAYHLGGMGCATGVTGIGLVKDLLQAHPNSTALFVAYENVTAGFYQGEEKNNGMVANAIFRMGGAAVLLTNKPQYRSIAKYQLIHNARVHTGKDDEAFQCMGFRPDKQGIKGMVLGRDIAKHAGRAVDLCLQKLQPQIMTWQQWGQAALNVARKKFLGSDVPEYKHDYTRCIDHFAIHAGGYAVLKGMQGLLNLPAQEMLPSFAALRDYGNTGCSTTWYSLSYMETCGRDIKRGQKLMQIGMGGCMQAGVNIWVALKDIRSVDPAWQHLNGRALTEADLPRAIDEETKVQRASCTNTEVPAKIKEIAAAAMVNVTAFDSGIAAAA